MKPLFIGALFVFCFTQAFSQIFIPRNVESALNRIESAIRNGDPASVEDLIQSGITMRLEDSLYQRISSITAMNLLWEFFTNKDSIDFRFGLPAMARWCIPQVESDNRLKSMYGSKETRVKSGCTRSTSATILLLQCSTKFIRTQAKRKNETHDF